MLEPLEQPELQECEKLLRDEINRINHIPVDRRVNRDYYVRNLLFFGWLLSRRAQHIDIRTLLDLLGISLESYCVEWIRRHCTQGYMTFHADQTAIIDSYDEFNQPNGLKGILEFSPNLMLGIENVLRDAKYNYKVLEAIPYFEGLTGEEFLVYTNWLDKNINRTTAVQVVTDALRNALPQGIHAFKVEDIPDFKGTRSLSHSVGSFLRYARQSEILQCARLVSHSDGTWHFILIVFPHTSALDKSTVSMLIEDVSALRISLFTINKTKFPGIPALVISSAVDSQDDLERIKWQQVIHYSWNLSILRLFHLLEPINKLFAPEPELVIDHFDAIFNEQNALAFSATRAIESLVSAIVSSVAEAAGLDEEIETRLIPIAVIPSPNQQPGIVFEVGLQNSTDGKLQLIHFDTSISFDDHPIFYDVQTYEDKIYRSLVVKRGQLRNSPKLEWLTKDMISGRLSTSEHELLSDILLKIAGVITTEDRS